MANTIVFYDIPSTLPGVSWSPNTWKTRYTLNYKRIPYITRFVEYPDIEPTAKELGALPTGKRDDGSPFYTFPILHDPSTGKTISDSANIADYLENQYPDTPKLAPVPKALENAFVTAHKSLILPHLYQFALPKTLEHLNPRSHEYYNRTKFRVISSSVPTGERHTELLDKFEADFGVLEGWYNGNGVKGPYLVAETPSFLDFVVGAFVLWMRRVFGEDSVEWRAIKGWHGGRWANLVEALKPYEIYDKDA